MRKPISTVSLATALLLTACVTINIYFPAAAAEKAADKIIQEIQETPPESTGSEPQSRRPDADPFLARVSMTLLDFVVTPARAEADLSVDSPAVRRIQSSMANRFNDLLPFYRDGSIGILASGLLVVRNPAEVPLKDRNRLSKLVAAENGDRMALYQAIADANGHPEWRDDIRATFAKRWVANAKPGWWYQGPDGGWRQK